MNQPYVALDELKRLYPDEWVLLGNPEMENTTVLGGVVLHHSKDKKEVCYLGRNKTAGFASVTVAFAGDLKPQRQVGILRRL